MPIETLDDIIEELADLCGIYGAHDDKEPRTCRVCWTLELRLRIDAAMRRPGELRSDEAPVPTTSPTKIRVCLVIDVEPDLADAEPPVVKD
jgi:hypothetical protein